jgi:cohesin loading factor subunit SCC2
MRIKAIQSSVILRLTDDSISVREAALSLIGSHVSQSPSLANAYHQALLKCLEDTGVSVRKRAVKIFESVLSVHPTYKGRATALSAMLKRAIDPKEEDSVRDLINELLSALWFDDTQKSLSATAWTPDVSNTPGLQDSPLVSVPNAASVRGMVTPTPPVGQKTNLQLMTKPYMVAVQMMEVVRSAGSGEILEHLLENIGQKDVEKGSKDSVKEHLAKVVDSLFELLLSIEEDMSNKDLRDGKDLVATLETIAVLAKTSPRSVCDKIETVLPYLKGDNGAAKEDEPAILAATCDIIHRLACALGEYFVSRLSPKCVSEDLKQISFRFGPSAFRSAIRAFSSLASCKEGSFSSPLLELARKFYTYLIKRASSDDFEQESVSS